MPHIPGSVPVTGFIAPSDSGDTYATLDPLYGIDGLRSVANSAERNAIPPSRRREGMLVFTRDDGQYWQMGGDLTTWATAALGGGGGTQGRQGVVGPPGGTGQPGPQGQTGFTGSIGLQGAQGFQGQQGLPSTVQGPLGTQGNQGITGAGTQGVAGAIGVQGNQGNQGQTGAGTQGAIGPVGPGVGSQGNQGLAGNQGFQGQTGAGSQGNQGVQGFQGNQGLQGLTGAGTQGNQGVQGFQGNQGFQGLTGAGTQGNQGVIGPVGPGAGAQGDRGFQGFSGNQGFQGLTGAGTQGNQGVQGFQGNQGFQGLTGTGTQGNQGVQGNQGLVGTQGNQGLTGAGTQGNQGNQGNQGAIGTQGNQGLTGAGTQGNQGVQGFQGFQGLLGNQGNQGLGPQGVIGNQGNQGLTGAGTQGNQGVAGGGGGGTPGGSTTQIQYNLASAFAGDASFVYNETNDTVTLGASGSTSTTRRMIITSGTSQSVSSIDVAGGITLANASNSLDVVISGINTGTSATSRAGVYGSCTGGTLSPGSGVMNTANVGVYGEFNGTTAGNTCGAGVYGKASYSTGSPLCYGGYFEQGSGANAHAFYARGKSWFQAGTGSDVTATFRSNPFSSQTGNWVEFGAGGNMAYVTSYGQFWSGQTSASLASISGTSNGGVCVHKGAYGHFFGMNTMGSSSTSGSGVLLFQNDTTTMVAGERLGNIVFGGYNSVGLIQTGAIQGFAEGTWSGSNGATYLTFETAPTGGTTRTERMRIAADGEVKIPNATATVVPLAVQAAASQTANIQEWRNSGGTVLSGVNSLGHLVSAKGSQAPVTTPGDGALFLDTTANKLYARCGGAWVGITLS